MAKRDGRDKVKAGSGSKKDKRRIRREECRRKRN